MLNGRQPVRQPVNSLPVYQFGNWEPKWKTGNWKIFIILLCIYILIILLALTDRKINNHAPRQPFPWHSNVSYMLLWRNIKRTPPETTCDAYTPLVISHDVTSCQSFVARRTVWACAANTQHAHRLHCIMSTLRAQSQMMQGKLTRCWRLVVVTLASATRFQAAL